MKLKSCFKLTHTLLLLSSIPVSFIAFLPYANAQNKLEVIKKQPYSRKITGEIKPSTKPVNTPLQTDGITIITPFETNSRTTPRAIASPANNVSTFNITVVKNPFYIILYDPGTIDGDIVRLIINGRIRKDSIILTGAKLEIPTDLKPGVNRIEVVALNQGSISPNTVGIEYRADQVLAKRTTGVQLDLLPGASYVTSVGFPQIALCLTNFTFPCTTRIYPESAQHVLEAQGTPPQPITAAFKGTGNPLRLEYPRLLTIDRGALNDKSRVRRYVSTRNYVCPDKSQDKDEYPGAVFEENNYSAHIKCINLSDNRGSGNSYGMQINKYKVSPTSPPVKLDDKDVIEFVILR